MGDTAYIGIGSNLGDRLTYLRQGLSGVVFSPAIRLLATSSIFSSDPLGSVDQPDFLNAVFAVDTFLEPEALLRHMRAIEEAHGRQRTIRWGPRTLDLDLLLYGDRRIRNDVLTLPHPLLLERCFVLVPLCELAADHRHPTTGSRLSDHLRDLDCGDNLERYDAEWAVSAR